MSEKVVIRTVAELRTWVGKEMAVGKWITVTQELIDKFAEASGDFQWIHVDVELPPSKMGINYGANKIRFTGVVPSGSRIRGRYKLLDVKDVDGGNILLTWGVTGEIEGGTKPVLIAESLSRRSAGEEA